MPPAVHEVAQVWSGNYRRWECAGCDWATEWTIYTNAGDAAAAIRHQTKEQR